MQLQRPRRAPRSRPPRLPQHRAPRWIPRAPRLHPAPQQIRALCHSKAHRATCSSRAPPQCRARRRLPVRPTCWLPGCATCRALAETRAYLPLSAFLVLLDDTGKDTCGMLHASTVHVKPRIIPDLTFVSSRLCKAAQFQRMSRAASSQQFGLPHGKPATSMSAACHRRRLACMGYPRARAKTSLVNLQVEPALQLDATAGGSRGALL